MSSQKGVGWFAALADPHLNVSMGAMHANPSFPWTLQELAARAGMSRSSFAQHFRDRVGETPIALSRGGA
jgi:AraC-like DNA-binding protein